MNTLHSNDQPPKLKICHVITGLTDGGAEAVLYRLCTFDKQAKHIVVSLLDSGKYRPLLETAGIEVHGLGMTPKRISPRGLLHLWRLLREERPDAVQTWMYHADFVGGIVAKLARIPIINWGIRNSSLKPGKSSKSTLIILRLCAWLSHWIPNTIVSCSAQAAALHQAHGYVKEKFTIIPNGYHLNEFAPDPKARERLRNEWAIDDSTILIGMAARFDPQKDHATLLAALKLIKQKHETVRYVLVGADIDTDNQELCRLIDDLGIKQNILLLGERSDIPAIMSALDINVLSSSYGEAFPNVLAEAMACGTPCVSTDVGDAARIVGDTGWIVPCSNPDMLADAILQAIADRQNADKWAARKAKCRDRIVLNYSLGQMVENYHKTWRNIA